MKDVKTLRKSQPGLRKKLLDCPDGKTAGR